MTMKDRRDQGKKLPSRGFLVGLPGAGKSTAAAFQANAMTGDSKVFFIDANGESLAGCEEYLDDNGAQRFVHIPVYPDNLEVKGPQAREKSLTTQIEEILDQLAEQGELDSQDNFVFIDCITDICNDLMRINHKKSASSGQPDMLRTYGSSQNEYVDFHTKIINKTRDASIWFIGHLKEVEIVTGKVQYGMDAITNKYSVAILNSPGISNLFVYERNISKNGEIEFSVLMKPTQKMPFIKNTCSTVDNLPERVPQEWFLPSFIKCTRTKTWEYPVKSL